MKAFLVFVYSLVAYAAGMGSLVVFILFQGDWLLPLTVNTGSDVPLMSGLLLNFGLLLLWTVQHSVMARGSFKEKLVKVIPASAERSTFVLATGVVLALMIYFWQGNSTSVWALVQLEIPLRVLSLAGWGLLVWATFEIDHWDLFGLKEPFCKMAGRGYRQREFVTPLLYRYVRHPMQLGILIGLWSQATMSQGQLLLTLGMTIYVFIGLYFEEQDLRRHFGDRYRLYIMQVPRLFPRLGRRSLGRGTIN